MSQSASVPVDSIRQYLTAIGRHPLLSAEQELEYGQQVQRCVQLQQERDRLAQQQGKSLTDAEFATAIGLSLQEIQAIRRSGDRAKRRLVESNLRLVVSVAKKYQKFNLELLDLFQEGSIGLQRAVEKFDPSKGYRFSTYAYWWIRQGITRAISEQSRTVRLPVHLTEKLVKIKKAQRQLSIELGRAATIAELALLTGMKPQQVRECLLQSRQPMSLDLKIGDDQSTTLSDLLEDESTRPEDYVAAQGLREQIETWLDRLTRQQQDILRLRYGLGGTTPMTLQEIANQMNLTRERIRQIEKSALTKLKHQDDVKSNRLYFAQVS